jgi:hypothetical protein
MTQHYVQLGSGITGVVCANYVPGTDILLKLNEVNITDLILSTTKGYIARENMFSMRFSNRKEVHHYTELLRHNNYM